MSDDYLKGIMNRDGHNIRVLENFRGIAAQPGNADTDADPRNPNIVIKAADGGNRGLHFSEGAFDRSADIARIAELEAALKPFSTAAHDLNDKALDQDHIWESPAAMNITAGDLRRALAVTNGER
jgi:hypothetical protein